MTLDIAFYSSLEKVVSGKNNHSNIYLYNKKPPCIFFLLRRYCPRRILQLIIYACAFVRLDKEYEWTGGNRVKVKSVNIFPLFYFYSCVQSSVIKFAYFTFLQKKFLRPETYVERVFFYFQARRGKIAVTNSIFFVICKHHSTL